VSVWDVHFPTAVQAAGRRDRDEEMTELLNLDAVPLLLETMAAGLAIIPRDDVLEIRSRVTTESTVIDFCAKCLVRSSAGEGGSSRREVAIDIDGGVGQVDVAEDRRRSVVKGALQLLGNLLFSCEVAQV
jgi:hypothetical protein